MTEYKWGMRLVAPFPTSPCSGHKYCVKDWIAPVPAPCQRESSFRNQSTKAHAAGAYETLRRALSGRAAGACQASLLATELQLPPSAKVCSEGKLTAGGEGPHSLSAPEEQLEGCQHRAPSTGHPQSSPDCSFPPSLPMPPTPRLTADRQPEGSCAET